MHKNDKDMSADEKNIEQHEQRELGLEYTPETADSPRTYDDQEIYAAEGSSLVEPLTAPLSSDSLEPASPSGRQKKKSIVSENAKILIKDILIALAIALALSFFFQQTVVRETSMEPTVSPNDYLILSRQAYTFGEIQRGDIIVFRSDLKLDDTHYKLLIKRVIAVAGDTITIRDGNVYLNGELLDEPYIAEGGTDGNLSITVPTGRIFVMGDNRSVSVDSRTLGTIEVEDVVGKAIFRVFPFTKIGTLD